MRLDEPSVRWAVFGKQVEDFLSGDIGRYLVSKCEAESDEATSLLKVVHPWRTRRVRELQNRIMVSEAILRWLANAIEEGHAAVEQLKGEQ